MQPGTQHSVSFDERRSAGVPARPRLSFVLECVLAAAVLHFPLANAQDNYDYLLFDPVLLEIIPPGTATGEASPHDARELTALPTQAPQDLHALLNSQQSPVITPDVPSLEQTIARYQRAITELELAGGPYEPRLAQELLALGTALQQAGDFTTALQVLERATHINRVNGGLFNLEQIPIIEKSIENYLARGDLVAADGLQEYLFYLQRKSLGENTVDLLPALTSYAEWNVFAFNARPFSTPPRAPADSSDPAASITPVYNPLGMEGFRTRSLLTAQNIYQSIIQILRSNFGTADPRLPDLEKQLALTNYYFATSFAVPGDLPPSTTIAYSNNVLPYDMAAMSPNALGFREGREALERRVDYLQDVPHSDPAQVARASQDLGDWQLIFKKRSGALEVYNEAWQTMQRNGASAEELAAVFSPPLPVEIPEFLAHPYSRAAFNIPANVAIEYKGFIDVEYALNRFGIAGDIRVLGKTAETPEFVESRLVRSIRRAQFRPRQDDSGQIRDSEKFRVRYYYTH